MIRNAIAEYMLGILIFLGAMIVILAIGLTLALVPVPVDPDRANCEHLGGFYSTERDTCTIMRPGQ
jgi:hypothetical protein